jgi:hypothetical protein
MGGRDERCSERKTIDQEIKVDMSGARPRGERTDRMSIFCAFFPTTDCGAFHTCESQDMIDSTSVYFHVSINSPTNEPILTVAETFFNLWNPLP